MSFEDVAEWADPVLLVLNVLVMRLYTCGNVVSSSLLSKSKELPWLIVLDLNGRLVSFLRLRVLLRLRFWLE